MSIVLAALIGGFVGSLPTALWLARARGVDLTGGSGNPGANNAWRLGGKGLGASVLLIEMFKGVAAVLLGWAVGGPWGAATAGVTAAAGNLINPWLGFRGGQGLGITAGILGAGWPVGLAVVLTVVAAITVTTKSSHRGAATGVVGMAFLTFVELPSLWGLSGGPLRLLLLGLVVILLPKQIIRLVRTNL